MKEEIIELYLNQNLSIKKVSKLLKISRNHLRKLISIYNISKTKDQIKESIINTNMERYGFNVPIKNKEVSKKLKQTCLKKYGVDNYAKTSEYIDKVTPKYEDKSIQNKRKQTCLKKYGIDNYKKTIQYKQQFQELCSKGIPQEKRYQTMKKNGTLYLRVSKEEEQVYQLLLTKFLVEDIERQYKSELYPFKADFYIKSLDLYIEYQGNHFHGKHPYNPLSQKDLDRAKELYEKGKISYQRQRMLEVWTRIDPRKRRLVKRNNLNWKEFFSINEVKMWLTNLSE